MLAVCLLALHLIFSFQDLSEKMFVSSLWLVGVVVSEGRPLHLTVSERRMSTVSIINTKKMGPYCPENLRRCGVVKGEPELTGP